ncbi:hypothetical protein IPdc08_00697 [archaeon]|nr:hypothetical protein IPdc08_00697 [archaeon]
MIIYSPAYLKHHLGGHPENKYRLEAIIELLMKKNLKFVEPVKASEEDILRVHSLQHYLKSLEHFSKFRALEIYL